MPPAPADGARGEAFVYLRVAQIDFVWHRKMHMYFDLRKAVDSDWLGVALACCDWLRYKERECLFLHMC